MIPNRYRLEILSLCEAVESEYPKSFPIVVGAASVRDWLHSLPEAPRPDWSSAPEWANWWAVDADGQEKWFSVEPKYTRAYPSRWFPGTPISSGMDAEQTMWKSGDIEIPIGIDWRTLIQERPKEAGSES